MAPIEKGDAIDLVAIIDDPEDSDIQVVWQIEGTRRSEAT